MSAKGKASKETSSTNSNNSGRKMAALVKCYKCKSQVDVKNTIQCSACKNRYEFDCEGFSEKLYRLMEPTKKKNWRCKLCKFCIHKGKHNTDGISNITMRKKAPSPNPKPTTTLNTLQSSPVSSESQICKYKPDLSDQIAVSTENSFDGLKIDSDTDANNFHENITTRRQKKTTSLPDLSASFGSTSDMNANLSVDKTSHSLQANTGNNLIIDELISAIQKLKKELEIANHEIENLNMTNQKLLKKTLDQEKIITLYKSLTSDDLYSNRKTNRSCASTPLPKNNKRHRREEKLKNCQGAANDSNANLHQMQRSNSDAASIGGGTACKTGKTTIKKPAKICIISSINHNSKSKILRKQFEDMHMCHYRMPGGNINQLLSGLETKLDTFTGTDYCIIMLGEFDFCTSKNYTLLVKEIRHKLLSVQHTNVIICVPTFKYSAEVNIFNRRLELFNKILYNDNLKYQYCYILDSNKNISYSFDMFSRLTGRINNHAFEIIVSDLSRLMLDIGNEIFGEDCLVTSLTSNVTDIPHGDNTCKKSCNSFRD